MEFSAVYRVVTFVPPTAVDGLLDGVMTVTPLVHGAYDHCAWVSAPGVERYRPLPTATPAAGSIGVESREASVRCEFSIPRDDALLERVLRDGIIPHHPWEEPEVFITACVELRSRPDAVSATGGHA